MTHHLINTNRRFCNTFPGIPLHCLEGNLCFESQQPKDTSKVKGQHMDLRLLQLWRCDQPFDAYQPLLSSYSASHSPALFGGLKKRNRNKQKSGCYSQRSKFTSTSSCSINCSTTDLYSRAKSSWHASCSEVQTSVTQYIYGKCQDPLPVQ